MIPLPDAPLSRRAFGRRLLQGAAAAAASWRAGLAAAPGPRPGAGWTLGCYTRPFDQFDLRTALDGIVEAGYRHCGLMTAKGRSWVILTAETAPEEAAQVGAELRQRGLQCLSVYGDFAAQPAVADNVRALQQLVEHCACCGSPDLLLGGTGEAGLQEVYYRAIREVCDFAAARGVRLSIKPHGGFIATGAQCREKITAVNHPNFRLWYDPGNILYYSDGRRDPVEDAADVDGWVVGMSAKDFLPPKEVLVTPGEGRVDFRRVLARLRQGGFTRGPILVETVARGEFRAVVAAARRAREFLEGLAGEFSGPDAAEAGVRR